MAELYERPVNMWSKRLALLFSGEILNVYASLDTDVIRDYYLLKNAILSSFCKRPDQYCKEFKYCRIGPNQNYAQFLTSMSRLFDFWYNSAKCLKEYEDLCWFMIKDNFLANLPTDIHQYIMDNDIEDLREIAK